MDRRMRFKRHRTEDTRERSSLLTAIAALLVGASASAATFSVNPTQIYLSGRTTSALLTLRNDSTETLRFQLSAFAWNQSATGEILLEPTQDVVFFPALLTLKQGEERRIRVGSTVSPGAIEKTYRIFVEELPAAGVTRRGLRGPRAHQDGHSDFRAAGKGSVHRRADRAGRA